MFFEMNLGGGTNIIDFLGNGTWGLTQDSATNTFAVTSGKKYFIAFTAVGGSFPSVGISSGATVDKVIVDNIHNTSSYTHKASYWSGIVTATSNTITMSGTNGVGACIQLD